MEVSVNPLYESKELVLNSFGSEVFPLKLTRGTGINILTPKQMLQRLPVTLAHVKVANTSENLLNEIRQIVYSLYQAKEITIKVFNNVVNSI